MGLASGFLYPEESLHAHPTVLLAKGGRLICLQFEISFHISTSNHEQIYDLYECLSSCSGSWKHTVRDFGNPPSSRFQCLLWGNAGMS